MIVCHSKQFLFIHIHRTGGTTIRELLEIIPLEDRQDFIQHQNYGSPAINLTAFNKYTNFAFVRNPWERLWSWYSLFVKYPIRQGQKNITFDKFLFDYPQIEATYGLDRGYFHFNQLDYIRNKQGKIIVDFIGRYENYINDLKIMFRKIDINLPQIPRLNNTENRPYCEQYSDNAREFVAEQCAEDIEFFKYQFEQ